MKTKSSGLPGFILKYSIYGMVPGIWFAYLGGISLWWGVAAGVIMVTLIGLPARLVHSAGASSRAHDQQLVK